MSLAVTLTGSLSVNNPLSQGSPGLGWSVVGAQFAQSLPFNTEGSVLVPANLSGAVINAVTNANPIVLTTATNHLLVTNDTVTISGVTGTTTANTTALVTVLSATTFSIPVAGNAAYLGGGTFTTANGIAIPLGQVASPHWAFFLNLDATHYVQLKNGVSGAVFARLLAGEPAFVPLDPACVPWALANTSSIYLQYGILSL